MKRIFITLIIATSIISCQNDSKKIEKTVQVKKVEESVDVEKLEKAFLQIKTLHSELLEFKEKEDFKKFGFGIGGPYNNWLKSVEAFEKNPDSKLLIKKRIFAGELKLVGMEYVSSNGEETEVTRKFNSLIENAHSVNSIEKVETASGNSNYEQIKKEYELIGKWLISNDLVKLKYPYEIYKKGDEYIGVIVENDFKTEILEKKGNDYFVKGNRFGEYYRIDKNNNMTLFDKDGELSSSGLNATKQ